MKNYTCECGKKIGHVGDKWIILYVLRGQVMCEDCWEKKTENND